MRCALLPVSPGLASPLEARYGKTISEMVRTVRFFSPLVDFLLTDFGCLFEIIEMLKSETIVYI